MAIQVSFPKQLTREEYFKCPIWFADEPKYVNQLNGRTLMAMKNIPNNKKRPVIIITTTMTRSIAT